jgi:hypothetical protein
MSQIIPIYIPTYINNAEYAPARVLPRLLFYNGLVDCQSYYIESGSLTKAGIGKEQTAFPYFDNYNVVTGSFPTTDSRTLLFNNEGASYGEIPTENLYTTYWETYVDLLYNPRTRLLNCSAIIPLADYNQIELNDIVNFRGNYYHLRAINDYSIKTGECNLQLLGPIIPDALDRAIPIPPTPPVQASSSVSWSYTESAQDGEFKVYDNATLLDTLTADGSGNTQISQSHYVTASLAPISFSGAGVTMSLNVNGGTTISNIGYTNQTISASFLVGAGQIYKITGSIVYNAPPAPSSVSWSYTENVQNGTFTVYDNTTTLATLTANGSGNAQVSQSHYVTASLVPVSYPTSGSVTMSLNVNGGTTIQVSSSADTTISASFLVGAGLDYKITGSILWNAPTSSIDPYLELWLDAGDSASYPGSGSTWYDLTSNNNDLTLYGSPSYDSTTGSFDFANSTSTVTYYARGTGFTSMSLDSNDFTIEVWQRYEGPTSGGDYIYNYELGYFTNPGGATDRGGSMQFYPDWVSGQTTMKAGGIRIGDNIPAYTACPGSPCYNKSTDYYVWRQLVLTKSGNLKMYVDGALWDSITTPNGTLYNTDELTIGSTSPNNAFFGQVPGICSTAIYKVWNGKVLTATEVLDSYNALKTRFGK